MNEHSHVAAIDVINLLRDANRKGATRCVIGPVALALLRGGDPPPGPGFSETLMGLPVEADDTFADLGWELIDDLRGLCVAAGRFTVHHRDDCEEL